MHDFDGPEFFWNEIANTEVALHHKSKCRELTATIADDLSVLATMVSLNEARDIERKVPGVTCPDSQIQFDS